MSEDNESPWQQPQLQLDDSMPYRPCISTTRIGWQGRTTLMQRYLHSSPGIDRRDPVRGGGDQRHGEKFPPDVFAGAAAIAAVASLPLSPLLLRLFSFWYFSCFHPSGCCCCCWCPLRS